MACKPGRDVDILDLRPVQGICLCSGRCNGGIQPHGSRVNKRLPPPELLEIRRY